MTVNGKYTNVELNPDNGLEPELSDVYYQGDYAYTYKKISFNSVTYYGWEVSINASETDLNQTSYGDILESINGKPVISLKNTFKNCVNLSIVPVIPSSVLQMANAFYGCVGLEEAPFIPEGVLVMQQTFVNCINLKTVPNVPSTVKIFNGTFANCTSLIGKIKVDVAFPMQASKPFENVNFETQQLTLEGDSLLIDTFGETGKSYCEVCNGLCHHDYGVITYTFTIGGREFQFEKNMTWEDWINSSYNTNGEFYLNPQVGSVVCGSNGRIRSPEGGQVSPSRVIKEGEEYIYGW